MISKTRKKSMQFSHALFICRKLPIPGMRDVYKTKRAGIKKQANAKRNHLN